MKSIDDKFIILHWFANYGHVPIAAMAILSNGAIVMTCNTPTQHAEEILLSMYRQSIISIFVTLEPCTACAFKISMSGIRKLFFANYNPVYGKYNYKNIQVFGGIQVTNILSNFFTKLRTNNSATIAPTLIEI